MYNPKFEGDLELSRKTIDELKQSEKEPKKGIESKEFFYSEKLEKYVAFEPVKVDERLVRAASECGIELAWNDEGKINNISWIEAKKLAIQLGAILLSPTEYWQVFNEAQEKGDHKVLEQLQSDQFTEWLDVVYEKDQDGSVWMTEHPEIIETIEGVRCEGKRVRIDMPEARPGWFDPKDNLDLNTGLPLNIDMKRKKMAKGWKFWSVFKINEKVSPIRGYVTSSGTPSLDLDIPIGAKQPVLMLRECRKELLDPPINPELMRQANEFVGEYLATTVDYPAMQNPKEHEDFYHNKDQLFSFLKTSGSEFVTTREKSVQKIKEKFIDMLGIIRIMAKEKEEKNVVEEVDRICQEVFNIKEKVIDFSQFVVFIKNSKEKLNEALNSQKRIVFVMGHKNPDTDTAVSCLAESYRNSLIDEETTYIPVIQGARIPDEIKRLLGDEISDSILLSNNPDYEKALNSGQARWILVDQNVSDVQRFAISIVDHHLLSDKAKKQDISKSWEMVGSTTAMIVQKLNGMGLDIDKDFSKVLLGATLMDTENRSHKKMTYRDKLIMNDLKKTSDVQNENEFYQDLMSNLLNTDYAQLLFDRDYKQDWGIFGFAVAKVKGAFSQEGEPIKKDLLSKLVELAEKNNKKKNFPLTIVKLVDYLENNETVNRERVYLIFNEHVLPEFKTIMFEFIKKIIRKEFGERVKISQSRNSIDFWGTGDQLSRKATAPFLEPVVEAFNEYYFSPSTKLHVKREFLKADPEVIRTASELNIELSVDKQGRINNITYPEAKLLLDRLGMTTTSAPEYWKVLKEAEEIHDEQMLAHLRTSGFVEFLDTVILDKKTVINHPKVVKTEKGYGFDGERQEIEIPEAHPGLIHPKDIDPKTGFPMTVQDPRNYEDKSLWRYWSPGSPHGGEIKEEENFIVTRGHIFLLDQPAFDTKIFTDEALANLGIRPCCYQVKPPKVEFIEDEKGVHAKIIR